MALEIKELTVKVRVTDGEKPDHHPKIDVEALKEQILEECLAQLQDRLTWSSER